jgi:CRISPR/Cas system-associated exonuclease Cas4 (RecB family)
MDEDFQEEDDIDEEPALTPEWAESYRHLATILGVPKSTVFQWKKMPGAPKPDLRKRQNVDEWRAFMEANQLGQQVSEEDSAIKRRKLKADAEYREILVDIKKREYVRFALVDAAIRRLAAEAIALLVNKFCNELPPINAGRTAVEIQEENRKAIEEVCAKINAGQLLETLEAA